MAQSIQQLLQLQQQLSQVPDELRQEALGIMAEVETAASLNDWSGEKDNVAYSLGLMIKCMNQITLPTIPQFKGEVIADIKKYLTQRLKIVQEVKENPKVTEVPIKAPVFIIGNGRTGSTYLHNLISQDPLTRCPLLYEMIHPNSDVPTQERIASARAFVDDAIAKTPRFVAMHHMDPKETEECSQILACDMMYLPMMMASPFSMVFFMQPYERKVGVYKFHKLVMQLFEYQNPHPHEHWTFKSPLHTLNVKAIRAVYPDAKFIMLHRDPTEVVSSLIGLTEAFTNWMYVGDEDTKATWKPARAQEMLKTTAASQNTLLQFMGKWAAEGDVPTIIHSRYEDLKNNPIEEVQRIYEELGREFTPEFLKRLEAQRTQTKDRKVSYTHSLEGTGITRADVDNAFSAYYKAYPFMQPKQSS